MRQIVLLWLEALIQCIYSVSTLHFFDKWTVVHVP